MNFPWITVALLVVSNMLMTYAWYGHLKNMAHAPVWQVVLVSWSVAFLEYCFLIPANRIGAKALSLDRLKIIQEAISLLVFIPFSVLFMKNAFNWNYLAAAGCILGAVYFVFRAPLP